MTALEPFFSDYFKPRYFMQLKIVRYKNGHRYNMINKLGNT
jgi:hypothetical protein